MFKIFNRNKTEQALEKSKKSWFSKIAGIFDRPSLDQGLWDELEEVLIGADVGMETATKLLTRLQERVKKEKLTQNQQVYAALKQEIAALLQVNGARPSPPPVQASPTIILVIGVNGSGKTTSIAKLARSYRNEGKQVILAAGDTFRAAAIDQLRTWGQRLDVEVVAHQPGADPGAVIFDAVQAARSRGADVLIADTAGRLHTKFNLMEELKKIKRATQRLDPSAPHESLLVLDATTGQNGLAQAKSFAQVVGVTGIILSKIDSTAKGGIALAISDQLQIPIQYMGTGEGLDDLVSFDPALFAEALLG